MKNAIAANVSVNCHSKKVRYKLDCNILHKVSLAIMFLLMVTIICYHYTKQRSNKKNSNLLTL